ncbi:hypothetical protein EIN_334100 [Entamoeba invadens IP1]|uniref:Auxin efflux carrier family protein n=1 Tax=Entamoeba invadens IP1 TaxID=370355 RepID=A0A0A1UG82_ENTIV|nr:hypothetical protein EIN_334100 [Entamoeba invadens IP1]ELP92433.1 hypothetical protein EIN_334100 [Entamoeba invadens IP1]|eukprot:XP_004259204.1 hypothetical protein EIN_334100 [Entamoeba invadens IP1]
MILRLPKTDNRVFAFTLGFKNVMYLTMATVEALTLETDELGENAKELGFSYICVYQLTFMVAFFVLGYNFINLNTRTKDNEEDKNSKEENVTEMKIDETTLQNNTEISMENSFEKSPKPKQTTGDTELHISSSKKQKHKMSKKTKKEEKVNLLETEIEEEKVLETPVVSNVCDLQNDEQKAFPNREKIHASPLVEIEMDDSKTLEEKTETVEQNFVIGDTQTTLEMPLQNSQHKFSSKITQIYETLKLTIKKVITKVSQPFIFLWSKLPEIVRFSIKNFFSIPTMSAIFGIIFMLIKPLRDTLLVSGNWSIIGRCIYYLGSPTVFCALFLLGGSLANGPKGGNIKTWKILVGIIYRMVICPVVSWVSIYMLYKYQILPQNKVMYFVLQIESFSPPALNSLIVVNVCYPKGVDSTSTILFWCYMLAIFTFAVDIVITMNTI